MSRSRDPDTIIMVKASWDLTGWKSAEYVRQIHGTEEAMLGRNLLEMFVVKLISGKLFFTLLLLGRFE